MHLVNSGVTSVNPKGDRLYAWRNCDGHPKWVHGWSDAVYGEPNSMPSSCIFMHIRFLFDLIHGSSSSEFQNPIGWSKIRLTCKVPRFLVLADRASLRSNVERFDRDNPRMETPLSPVETIVKNSCPECKISVFCIYRSYFLNVRVDQRGGLFPLVAPQFY